MAVIIIEPRNRIAVIHAYYRCQSLGASALFSIASAKLVGIESDTVRIKSRAQMHSFGIAHNYDAESRYAINAAG